MGFSASGKNVLITGAAMGMGRRYADLAADARARTIVLWDINEAGLDQAAGELRERGASVIAQVVNVADRQAIVAAAAELVDQAGVPDVVINNAGVVREGYYWDNDPVNDVKFVMDINAMAPMYLTSELLPKMIERGTPARIVTIASAAGTLAQPRMAVYAASKWSAIGWSDSLRVELRQAGHKQIKVTTVCPSFIDTGMFSGARGPLLTPILQPDDVVKRVWQAMLKGRPQVMMPFMVYVGRFARAVLPVPAYDFIADRIGLYSTMDDFKGH
jgi:NAD(P)-dependent dehydrogenase (short-subunit alcohol dehydrogenase family)